MLIPVYYFLLDFMEERWCRGEMSEEAKFHSVSVLEKVIKNIDKKIMAAPLNEELMRLVIYKDCIQEAIDTIKFLKRK